MNRNTGNALRSACAKVLPVLDNWQQSDVRELDVEDVLVRFVHLHNKDFKPDSLEAYKRRFRQGVSLFLDYIDDPAAWQPSRRPRRSRKREIGDTQATKSAVDEPSETPVARGHLKGTNLHEYEYPIREGVMARLTVPRDVSSLEMKRLLAWAKTLATDFELE